MRVRRLQQMAQGLAHAASLQLRRNPGARAEASAMLKQAHALAERAGALASRLQDEAAAEREVGRILDEGLAAGPLEDDEMLPRPARFACGPTWPLAGVGSRTSLPH